MKKILTVMLAALMVCGIFTACAKPEEQPSAQPTKITTTESQSPASSTESPESIPTDISPTTGLPGNTVYKPIMVQIDNAANARPQTGISYADIVYETDVDGSDTRLTALYNDAINGADAPEELIVGPVRSSRYYFQWIQGEWDALYVHMGGPDSTSVAGTDIWGESSEHIQQRINGAGKHAVNSDLFFPLIKGKPVSDFAGIDLMKALAIYDYTPKQLQTFQFYPLQDYADQHELSKIEFPFFRDKGFISYEYDKEKDKLLRFMKGNEFKDATTGEQVEVQNLIVEFVNDQAAGSQAAEADRRIVDVKGSGDAMFVVHGKLMKGTWQRASYDSPTTYLLENGERLTLAPGNTWIEMHPTGKEVVATLADGSTETTIGKSNE